ncbi:hypothetical protein [Aeromicrobium flavum]|uniref:hypothetical protein n=1 Tax=Aeromicrobium flavum TaxID=416568 RepID=UPI0011BDBA6A|nr:hypothetical protein [Aeromicrobium flavum]
MTTGSDAAIHPPATAFRDSHWGSHTYVWPDLESFLANDAPKDGVHAFELTSETGTLTYEFYVRVRPGTPLVAHFHGNAPRRENDLPVITGLGVSSDLDASLFVLSDPVLSLDDTVTLGWHIGPAWLGVHPVTVAVVDHLARVSNAPRVVAWGGSGGGYAALRVARDIDTCVALVWNPQTNVDRYAPEPVDTFRRVAGFVPGFAFTNVRGFNLTHASTTTEFRGTAIVLQERTDWHFRTHLAPMLTVLDPEVDLERLEEEVVSEIGDHLVTVVSHWGQGHAPPPKAVLRQLLAALSSTSDVDLLTIARDTTPLLAAAAALATEVDPFTASPSAPLDDGTDANETPLDTVGQLAERALAGDEEALTDARRAMVSLVELTEADAHAPAARVIATLLYLKASRHHGVDDLDHLRDVLAALFRDVERLMDDDTLRGALALLHVAVQFAPGFGSTELWDTASSRIAALLSAPSDGEGPQDERSDRATWAQVRDFVSGHRPNSSLAALLAETPDSSGPTPS